MGYPRHWMIRFGVLAACVCGHVQAFELRGSFSGTAAASALPLGFEPPTPISFFDGATVYGSFAIDVPDPHFQTGGSDYAYFLNGNGGKFAMSFSIKGHSYDYTLNSPPDVPSELLLAAAPGAQSLTALTSFNPKYDGAWFTLTGTPGSLFSGLDANSLHADAALPYTFSASFRDASSALGINVNASDLHLNAAAPVPEPTVLALLLFGSVLLVARTHGGDLLMRPQSALQMSSRVLC